MGKDIEATASKSTINLAEITDINTLLGKGLTIGGVQVEFYNADKGAYDGNALGVNISEAANIGDVIDKLVAQTSGKLNGVTLSKNGANSLDVTAAKKGVNSNVEIENGGKTQEFKATLQIGANKDQSFTIEISDMRADALGLTGAGEGFTANVGVTDGTNNTATQSALDLSNHSNSTKAIEVINSAINTVSTERSKMGAMQNRLEYTINNLDTSAENLQASESRIRDVDMAKEMLNFSKENILQQAAQSMLAQAKSQPEGVLQLLR